MKKQTLLILSGVIAGRLAAQDAQADLRRGNDLYRQQQYPAAEAAYEEAGKKDPSNLASKFNKANAMHRQNKQSAAIRELDDLSFKATDNSLKSQTQYNKGVILSGLGKTEESIESYKAALRLDPTDNQARENLQKALKELEKKKQEPKPDKQQKQQSRQQQQQQPQPQPQMNQKEAEQRLKLLEQKEKEVQQRLQREKSKQGSGTGKDW